MFRLSGSAIGLTIRIATIGAGATLLSGCLTTGLPGRLQDVDRTVNLTITNDTAAIDPIAVRRGETVRLVLKNSSERARDCVVGAPFVRKQRRAHMHDLYAAHNASAGSYDPGRFDTYNAVYVLPGATKELIWWSAGPRPLELGCDVPGFAETRVARADPVKPRRKPKSITAELETAEREQPAVAAVRPMAKPLPPAAEKLEPSEPKALPPRSIPHAPVDRHPAQTVQVPTPVQVWP